MFDLTPYRGEVWRLVEAQHHVATLKLVDSLAEQAALEELLERSKPRVPAECAGLDYLLATPFRYDAPYPHGSRFRRAGRTPGVFYAAERVETAVAEMAFHRLLFFAEAPGVPTPTEPAEFTAFSTRVATDRALDLTAAPWAADAARWTDPVDYGPCQDVADRLRAAEGDLVRSESARDPARGANVAVLRCRAFADRRPRARQTWRLRVDRARVQALCECPRRRIEHERDAFARDPRLATLG